MQRTKQMFIEKMSIKSPLTTLSYEKRIRYFEDWWAGAFPNDQMFDSLKGDDLWDILQMYVGYMAKTKAPNTVWNYITSVRKYLHYMGVKECDNESFRENVTLPEKHEKEFYPLKLDEIQIILDKMKYVDKALFLCQIACGARIGEMVQLRKKYFQIEDGRAVIKLPHTITKFHKARTTVLSKEALVFLKPILAKLQDEDLVFTKNPNVRSAVTIKETILRNALHRCNLIMRYEDTNRYKINTHSFRAYFITKASRSDANIAKKLAGEKGYLLQYDRLEEKDLVEAYRKFELELCIYDTAKKQLELDEANIEKSKLKEANKKLQLKDSVIDELTEKIRASIQEKFDSQFEEKLMKLADRKNLLN